MRLSAISRACFGVLVLLLAGWRFLFLSHVTFYKRTIAERRRIAKKKKKKIYSNFPTSNPTAYYIHRLMSVVLYAF